MCAGQCVQATVRVRVFLRASGRARASICAHARVRKWRGRVGGMWWWWGAPTMPSATQASRPSRASAASQAVDPQTRGLVATACRRPADPRVAEPARLLRRGRVPLRHMPLVPRWRRESDSPASIQLTRLKPFQTASNAAWHTHPRLPRWRGRENRVSSPAESPTITCSFSLLSLPSSPYNLMSGSCSP